MPEPGVRRGRVTFHLIHPPSPGPSPLRPSPSPGDDGRPGDRGPGLVTGSSPPVPPVPQPPPEGADPALLRLPLPMGSLLAKLTARYQGLTPQNRKTPRTYHGANQPSYIGDPIPSNLTPPGTRVSGTSCALRPEAPKPGPPGRRRRGRRPEGFGQRPNPRRRGNSLAPSRSNPPRPQGPRKAMLSWGPSTSWIEKSAATPQIWVEAASSSPTHASPGTRVSGTAWVRRHKRFGATPQNLAQGGFTPPEHVQ